MYMMIYEGQMAVDKLQNGPLDKLDVTAINHKEVVVNELLALAERVQVRVIS